MKLKLFLKAASIFFILILFTFALSLVEYKVDERQSYRNQATRTVANGWSQDQLLAGPVFELRYQQNYIDKKFNKELKQYVETEKTRYWSHYHLLESLDSTVELEMQERYVGIFKIPVYTAQIQLRAKHLGKSLTQAKRTNLVSASLLVSVRDMRGLANQPELKWNQKTIAFQPGDQQKLLGDYIQSNIPLSLLADDAELALNMTLRGVNSIGFVPTAQNVASELSAAWPHPSFVGDYLPSQRQISDQGFNATWGVNSFASSITKVLKSCNRDQQGCAHRLQDNRFGVQLASSVDVYKMTDRALKYGFMFICLTFVVFSLLELQKRYAIHPVQYGFVGASLAVFYLLVISLSEHIRFEYAYLIGSLACTCLMCGYLKVILRSSKLAALLGAAFIALYAMMYAILQSEDYAFLMGTLLIFALLAGIMYSTRNIDWPQFTKLEPKPMTNETFEPS